MRYYNFHGFISVCVQSGGRPRYLRYFDNEYSHIHSLSEAKSPSTTQVCLHIIKAEEKRSIDSATFRIARFKKLFKFEYAIVGFGTSNQKIYLVDHPVSRLYVTAVGVFVQAHLLEPLIYLGLLNQGVILMHAAGVANRNNKATLLPAQGGTGKTTTSIRLMEHGCSFLGDDLVLVSPELKMVYPYPRPLHLFSYNIWQLKKISSCKIPYSLAFIIQFKNFLRFFLEKLLDVEFLISTRVQLSDIFNDASFAPDTTLQSVFFLKKTGATRIIDKSDFSFPQIHSEAIADSFDLNDSLFMLEEAWESKENIRQREVELINAVLNSTKIFGYINVRNIDDEDLLSLIKGESSDVLY